jgi:hypothetical protein
MNLRYPLFFIKAYVVPQIASHHDQYLLLAKQEDMSRLYLPTNLLQGIILSDSQCKESRGRFPAASPMPCPESNLGPASEPEYSRT